MREFMHENSRANGIFPFQRFSNFVDIVVLASGLWGNFLFFFFLKKQFSNVYFSAKETEHEHGRGIEKGRQRIRSRLRAVSCQHRARYGVWTHKLRDHDLSSSRTLNQLSHPGAPREFFKVMEMFYISRAVMFIWVYGFVKIHWTYTQYVYVSLYIYHTPIN